MDFLTDISRILLPVLAVLILGLCLWPLMKRRPLSLGMVRLINSANGDSYKLTTREVSVGSNKKSDVALCYQGVSRNHAVIKCEKDGWYIRTLRPDIAVTVNGRRVNKSEMLKTGDKIGIGPIVLIFENR
ncbi:MAG: FHA domain-containing protein [Clostridiales bacterium]|nr:FHA domain-containing protein [Clostridiales bacterium]